ncbi:MAG: hydrogenase expression/formation protein HypE [Planctomycetaceae bacterium]|nr:hydrogenase expression/formation protein HypE [Planctomycetaceae bacterium]
MTRPTWSLNCPVRIDATADRVVLAHGEGARLSRQLLAGHILPRLGGGAPIDWRDAASVTTEQQRLAVTTDSFVVSPLFFPGGDIGSLSVHGTVNDLAVSGARPRWITLSMILEEGLPLAVLDAVLDRVAWAARECDVLVVAGDTKVVPAGAADGLFLNTTGIGELIDPVPSGPTAIQPGDALLVSGPIGRHGVAVLCAREEFGFDPPPQTDAAPLFPAVELLRASAGTHVRTIRDATRGGISAVLHEWAAASDVSFVLEESQIPVTDDVRGACELLGLDPLQIACEGTLAAAVSADKADAAIAALRADSRFAAASIIGRATEKRLTPVAIRRLFGSEQPVDEPTGALLPRIC